MSNVLSEDGGEGRLKEKVMWRLINSPEGSEYIINDFSLSLLHTEHEEIPLAKLGCAL